MYIFLELEPIAINPWYTETAATVSYRPKKLFFICLSNSVFGLWFSVLLLFIPFVYFYSRGLLINARLLLGRLLRLMLLLFYSVLYYFFTGYIPLFRQFILIFIQTYYSLLYPINCFWICMVESCPMVKNILFCWSYSTWVMEPACYINLVSNSPVRRENTFIYPF